MINLIRGDARQLALADASVDLIVTSPPYFALRSYTDGGQHYAGQVGSEATPAEFIAALVECTREWMRVLKPTGSIWVNLGDKYSGAQAQNVAGQNRAGDSARTWRQTDPRRTGIPNKSLMGLPWRYALACIDELGLILRAEVIWDKPNGLPESVTDRVRRSHEQWFHFVKQPRYFSAVDEIRESFAAAPRKSGANALAGQQTIRLRGKSDPDERNSLGKLPGSVWEIATQPLTVPKELGVDHFAAFPMEWPRRIILGWSPPGICIACGEGRRPVVESKRTIDGIPQNDLGGWKRGRNDVTSGIDNNRFGTHRTMIGYSCACPPCPKCDDSRRSWLVPGKPCHACPPTRPAVVLDPFGGTGTTALVASVLGRQGISVDMSADYCRLAQWRTTDAKQLERAKRPAKPRPTAPPAPMYVEPAPITSAEWLAHFGLNGE